MLNKEQLLNVYGGTVDFGVVGVVIAAVMFVIGVIDGYIRPLKCKE